MSIAEIDGGGLRNAIPRESKAIVAVSSDNSKQFVDTLTNLANDIKKEYKTMEPGLEVEISKTDSPLKVMDGQLQKSFIKSLYATWNGVFRMSADIPDLVETSNNLARVLVKDGALKILCLTRSSVESSKMDLAHTLRSVFELAGCDVEFSGSYPGWAPNMDSAILEVMEKLYVEMNGHKPNVAACHAGLECGILGTNYPEMDMISFGPTIKGAHSPDERASISSANKYYKYVLEILKNIPKK